eukprot:1623737-Rhodomonas_salina.2
MSGTDLGVWWVQPTQVRCGIPGQSLSPESGMRAWDAMADSAKSNTRHRIPSATLAVEPGRESEVIQGSPDDPLLPDAEEEEEEEEEEVEEIVVVEEKE